MIQTLSTITNWKRVRRVRNLLLQSPFRTLSFSSCTWAMSAASSVLDLICESHSEELSPPLRGTCAAPPTHVNAYDYGRTSASILLLMNNGINSVGMNMILKVF
ncbi:hypothetical protein STEG23_037610 [Scotinomys teguina]